MAGSGRSTLRVSPLEREVVSDEYAERCRSIGIKRRNPDDLKLAMQHPRFKAAHHKLIDDLAYEYAQMLPISVRPPFTKIKVGTFKNVVDLRGALIDHDYLFRGSYADGFLMETGIVPCGELDNLDLYQATNADLGLPEGSSMRQTFEAIEKAGGEKLTAEAGLQYFLQFSGTWIAYPQIQIIYMDFLVSQQCWGKSEVFLWGVQKRNTGRPMMSAFYYTPELSSGRYTWVFGRLRKRR